MNYTEYNTEYVRNLRKRLVKEERCIFCRKINEDKNHQICFNCREKEHKRKQRCKQDRIKNNLCSVCGTKEITKGYKTCSKCRASFREEYYRRFRHKKYAEAGYKF